MVLTVLGKIVESEAGMKKESKSPLCYGILYQPKRPKEKSYKKQNIYERKINPELFITNKNI